MGNFHLNSGNIQEFNIEIITEESGIDVIIVTIRTDIGTEKFRICDDERHKNLNTIFTKLQSGLQVAKNTNSDIQFNEYSERMYVFVTYPDGSLEQYTGSRI